MHKEKRDWLRWPRWPYAILLATLGSLLPMGNELLILVARDPSLRKGSLTKEGPPESE
jgi:hypothetical protein